MARFAIVSTLALFLLRSKITCSEHNAACIDIPQCILNGISLFYFGTGQTFSFLSLLNVHLDCNSNGMQLFIDMQLNIS